MDAARTYGKNETLLSCIARPARPWPGYAGATVGIAMGLALFWLFATADRAHAQAPNQAGLVVVHGSGQMVTRCVEFTESQISGLDLLARAGLDFNTENAGMGETVCRLDNEGCTVPQQSCFCQCEGANCMYWSYWRWLDGALQYSNIGAGNTTVLPGTVEGWVWGPGNVAGATPPAFPALAEICAPVAAQTSTAEPTHTPTLLATVAPTETLSPTNTLTPTLLPTLTPTPPPTPLPATATPLPSPTGTASPIPSATWTLSPLSPVGAQPPQIEFFAAERAQLTLGEVTVLRWRTANTTGVTLSAEGKTVEVPSEGTAVVAPPRSTIYTMLARGSAGEIMGSVEIAVLPPAAPAGQAQVPATAGPLSPLVAPPATMQMPVPTMELTLTNTPLPVVAPVVVPVTPSSTPPPLLPTVAPAVLDAAPAVALPSARGATSAPQVQLVALVVGLGLFVAISLGVMGILAVGWVLWHND